MSTLNFVHTTSRSAWTIRLRIACKDKEAAFKLKKKSKKSGNLETSSLTSMEIVTTEKAQAKQTALATCSVYISP